jgi:ergothioneine biosynthesis protein EgtC
MCRLVGYLGQPILVESLVSEPDHSLVVQSYRPQQMTAGLLNADGFGFGWYAQGRAFRYKNILPIWNDPNLSSLAGFISSDSILANVRSATPGLPVDLSNCQPFQSGKLLFLHNGFIQNFRTTLARPIADRLTDQSANQVMGNTDSEYIFALFLDNLANLESQTVGAIAPEIFSEIDTEKITNKITEKIVEAIKLTLAQITEMALAQKITASLNLILGDGNQLFACRYSVGAIAPTLYWQEQQSGVIIASEPLNSDQDWQECAQSSLIWVRAVSDPDRQSRQFKTQILALN